MPTNELNIFVHHQNSHMKVVTGASGMLGAHFVLELAKQNEQVVGLKRTSSDITWVKDLFAFEDSLQHETWWDRVIWRDADLNDIFSLEDALFDATEVFHCAGMVNLTSKDEKKMVHNNVTGTENLVNVLLGVGHDVTLLHISSISALGKPESGNTITVASEWKADKKQSPYAVSKYYGEIEAWRGANEGLSVISVLPGVIVGASINDAASSTPFQLIEKGKKYTSSGKVGLVSVRDVVSQSIALITNEAAFGKRFLLVADSWTFRQFMQQIAAIMHVTIAFKILSKSALTRISWLERVGCFFTRKTPQLSTSTIDGLSSNHVYDGSDVVGITQIPYSSIANEIERVVRWRKQLS